MKKAIAGLMVAAFAGIALAETYSQNAVGFITQTNLQKGVQYAMAVPFLDVSGKATNQWVFEDLEIVKNADKASKFFFWDGANEMWASIKWNALSKKWTGKPSDPFYIDPGTFFFYQPGADGTAILSGEVPDDVLTVPVYGQSHFTAMGLPYPVEMNFSDTELFKNAPPNASVYFWDAEGKQWISAKKNPLGGWGSNAKNKVLSPGEGFMYRSVSTNVNSTWTEQVPYEWPNVTKGEE